mgnify:FL=1
MKTKFAIGCLVQWYEIEIIKEYVDSLKKSLKGTKDNVIVDFNFNVNQQLEKINPNLANMEDLIAKFKNIIKDIPNVKCKINTSFITIADYRRWFLEEYYDKAEVLIQGESDALMPQQTFTVLDILHQQVKDNTPKYISTFGINKMWDNSWEPLEHVDFTNKPFINDDEDNWWSIRYTMNQEEMDSFNDKVEDLNIIDIKPHKFNGCGFIISSEAVKSGVNIPKGTFFIDDTALQAMARKILPDMPQYHFRNILIVHNRKHPKKRSYILNEGNIDYIDDKRKSTDWYNIANEFCKINDHNIFNPNHRFYTWDDVWETINKNNNK